MKGFGPHCVAHVSVVTVRFHEDAKNLRDRAAGQLQLHQLITKNLHRLRRGKRGKCGFLLGRAIIVLQIKHGVGCSTTDLVIRRQAWIMEGSLHQLHQQVLDCSLALGKPQQPLLQGGKAGDVLGDVEADRLSISVQELHHSQTV